jgi:hypothetical protein
LSYYLLEDFDDSIKQKIMQLYKREPSKNLSFLIETAIQQKMRVYSNSYDRQINDSIKKYNHAKSYEDFKEQIFQSEISNEINKILNENPSHKIMIISGQLNLQEAIPYLKEYVSNPTYNEETKMYAVCALAIMRVEDYEDRAATYYDIDHNSSSTRLAEIINSQKVWYTFMRRLKSEKYDGKCPEAYFVIRSLGRTLKKFPITDRPRFEDYIELDNGMIVGIPSKIEPVRIVPDDCGMADNTKKIPINPDHIKIVVDWMEANKGKYELQQKIERTF